MKQSIIILVSLVVGAFSYWLIASYFIDTEVQDELDPALQARLEAQRQVDAARQDQATSGAEQADTSAAESQETTEIDQTDTRPGVRSDGPFAISGTDGHPASGVVEVIESPEEKLVYYQNYDGTNCPDLKVYLSKDLEASDYVDLGRAKGNQGNLIYGVPLDVDLSEYTYVLTWCEAFGVLFDYAKIN